MKDNTQTQNNVVSANPNVAQGQTMQVGPFANLGGDALMKMYSEVYAQKQQIDYQFYYLCLEIQQRMAYEETYGPGSIPAEKSLRAYMQQASQPTPGVEKVKVGDKFIVRETVKGFSGMGRSIHQSQVDSIVQKELKKNK